jgi:outer membrane receptor protein involved in Fe transport
LLGVKGIDTQLQYQTDLPSYLAIIEGSAQLGVNAIWSHYLSIKSQENVATDIRECVGLFGWPCYGFDKGDTFPANKINITLDYSTGPLDIHLFWRWVDSMDNAAPLASATFGYPNPELGIPDVPSYYYFDLGFGYRFNDQLMLRAGINNLFDKQPPLLADAVLGPNTDTRLYDVFGRTYYFSFVWNVFE